MKMTFRIGLALMLAGSIVWQANEALADDKKTVTTTSEKVTTDTTWENEGGDKDSATVTKHADGPLTEPGTTTGLNEKIVDVENTVTSDDGEGGTVTTKTTTENITVTTEHTVTEPQELPWAFGQSVGVDAEGKTVTRELPELNSDDESQVFSEGVSIDNAMNATKGK